MHKTRKIIVKANAVPEKRKCNCLVFTTDEEYETMLCKTGHNFYAINSPGFKRWDTDDFDMPDNYCILGESVIPNWMDFDVIIIQHKLGQYNQAVKIQQHLRIPMIVVEHSIPQNIPKMERNIEASKQMVGDLNIFPTEEIQNAWGVTHNPYVLTSDPEEECIVKWKVILDQFYEGVV
tara:strand:- start:7588 stop:8121 length:534 start_codon:yes stop_codon:yes gene_type:complete